MKWLDVLDPGMSSRVRQARRQREEILNDLIDDMARRLFDAMPMLDRNAVPNDYCEACMREIRRVGFDMERDDFERRFMRRWRACHDELEREWSMQTGSEIGRG